jgi:hypothetical protein
MDWQATATFDALTDRHSWDLLRTVARNVQFGGSQHRAFGRRNSRTTCDISLMDRLNEAAKQIRTLPLEANLWQTQNICYKILHTNW